MRIPRPLVRLLWCAVALSFCLPCFVRSVSAQPSGRDLGVDYILLIDASYSMLLDPRNPGRAAEEVGTIVDEFVAAHGRRPGVGELNLRSGLFRHVLTIADQLLQSASDRTTVAIYAFNDRIVHQFVVELGPGNRPQVTKFLGNIAVGGDGTAIFSSVNEALDRVEALRLASKKSRRSTIFLFTDGKENREDISIDQILDRFGLLRSDENHYLYWRYYYPQVENEAPERAPETPPLLEKLHARGVELHDLSDLEAAFEKESVTVEPEAISAAVPHAGGASGGELVLRVSEKRTEQMDLHLDADFPAAAADGIHVEALPESVTLNAEQGTARLSVSLTVEREAEIDAPEEDRHYEGSIRITSPQVMLIKPSRVPVTLTVAGKGKKVPASSPAPTILPKVAAATTTTPPCTLWYFLLLVLIATLGSWTILRRGRILPRSAG